MPETNMTITEFLEARIAEDEAEAEKGWDHNGTSMFARDNYGCLLIKPSRVLAECAAKRAVVKIAETLHDEIEGEWGIGKTVAKDGWQDNSGTDLVRALAAVYASHPDFEQRWAP